MQSAERSPHTVDSVIANMSLADKIGQMFVIRAADAVMPAWLLATLERTQPGGVLFYRKHLGSTSQIAAYTAAVHASGRWVPPFAAIDQEGGPVTRISNDPAPSATVMATLPDEQVQRLAHERAAYLTELGFDVNFAPVADIAFTPRSTMANRAFGSDPQSVAAKVSAVVEGSRDGRIASAAKHFPGHGRTEIDSHYHLPTIDLSFDEWIETDALPFKAAINQDVEMIMLGHLIYTQWDDVPASISKVAVQHLREDLGYEGVAVTDDLGMNALGAWSPVELAAQSVDAGLDLLLFTSPGVDLAELIKHVQNRVERGDVSERRIDESVRRILLLKLKS